MLNQRLLTASLPWGILIRRLGGTGAAETPEPRQVREEASVRRHLWAPPANLFRRTYFP
jgi:hypothetical protein